MEQLTIGQIFSIENPDYYVMGEEWTIIEISYPNISFSYTKYWVRDMAYIPISTTDATFKLTDAVLTTRNVYSLAEFSLSSFDRRNGTYMKCYKTESLIASPKRMIFVQNFYV